MLEIIYAGFFICIFLYYMYFSRWIAERTLLNYQNIMNNCPSPPLQCYMVYNIVYII
jgi:hypothetical protein